MKFSLSMDVSRRNLLKGAMLGAAGVVATGALGACSTPKSKESALASTGEKAQIVPDETMASDVVVLGSGAAGMCAAIEAAQMGAKVVLLEKASILGGNTNFAEGVFGAGSSMQKDLGIEIDVGSLLQSELEFQNYKINRHLWENVMNRSADNIEWLLDLGVKFSTVTSCGDGEPSWHLYDGDQAHGANLIAALEKAADKVGVEIMTETAGEELIMGENGEVAGIYAKRASGEYIQFDCASVVLATGGFAANEEMVASMVSLAPEKMFYRGVEQATGDGIRMAQSVGGTTTHMATCCQIGATVPGESLTSGVMVAGAMEPTNIWVNQDGRRFYDESACTHMTRSTNAIQSQEEVWSIFDSSLVERVSTEGATIGFAAYVMGGTVFDTLSEDLEDRINNDSPYVFKADTIEELAQKASISVDGLKKTINDYNGYCDAGVDGYLGKPAGALAPLSKPPFYATRIMANSLNSMGGIKVNEKSEVMGEGYVPIPGLYAAGMECDGFSGETYGIIVPGSDQGIAVCTGRIAGECAAEHALA